jgi:hypothetical protein
MLTTRIFSYRILKKLEFPKQIFEKFSNMKFNANPSSGGHVIPCWRTDGQRDTRKLRSAFRNFAKAPKNTSISKMNKQLTLHSEFVDKFDREISVQHTYNSFFF